MEIKDQREIRRLEKGKRRSWREKEEEIRWAKGNWGERKKGRCGQRKKARAFKFRIRGERKEEEEKSKKTW